MIVRGREGMQSTGALIRPRDIDAVRIGVDVPGQAEPATTVPKPRMCLVRRKSLPNLGYRPTPRGGWRGRGAGHPGAERWHPMPSNLVRTYPE